MKSLITIGSAPYSVAIADFNRDNYSDSVVTNCGTGDGTFVIGATYSTSARSRPYTVVIGDFNNDNISDIAVASNIFLLYGYENGWADIAIACYSTDHIEILIKMC